MAAGAKRPQEVLQCRDGVPLLRTNEIEKARRQAEETAAAAEKRSRALEEELACRRRTLGGS